MKHTVSMLNKALINFPYDYTHSLVCMCLICGCKWTGEGEKAIITCSKWQKKQK